MSVSRAEPAVGLDLGSSYVKGVLLGADGRIAVTAAVPTGYDYHAASRRVLGRLGVSPGRLGTTGYGRDLVGGDVARTDITCLARGAAALGAGNGTLVDIGGQDCKVIVVAEGRVRGHWINRSCAAGTGAYLEFLAHRLELDPARMNELAEGAARFHVLNSFCTVFTGTEILDCLRREIPLDELVRGMYASIAERVRAMAPLEPPVHLTGGVAAHHPVLAGVFEEVTGVAASVLPRAQFVAALGAALLAGEGGAR